MDAKDQHRHIASLQSHWRANALKDARYNLNRAKEEYRAGNRVLAKAYEAEYRVDLYWANRRQKIAERERKRAG